MIYIEIEPLLKKQGWSFYRLAQVTGISNNALSRLRQGSKGGIEKAIKAAKEKGKTFKPPDSINFVVLEKICTALNCEIQDILKLEKSNEKGANQ